MVNKVAFVGFAEKYIYKYLFPNIENISSMKSSVDHFFTEPFCREKF